MNRFDIGSCGPGNDLAVQGDQVDLSGVFAQRALDQLFAFPGVGF